MTRRSSCPDQCYLKEKVRSANRVSNLEEHQVALEVEIAAVSAEEIEADSEEVSAAVIEVASVEATEADSVAEIEVASVEPQEVATDQVRDSTHEPN